eukprot:TRINITY_DN94501_c0_g1_i1.p1 TRINITY_DN94501_c0_g1~~TRINITY_DN94501_c0_g1_i1.p1  ORF type:complete len:311 (-),score=39.16 TRINITY_DN94501_c0_g1_i1:183-1049(-)
MASDLKAIYDKLGWSEDGEQIQKVEGDLRQHIQSDTLRDEVINKKITGEEYIQVVTALLTSGREQDREKHMKVLEKHNAEYDEKLAKIADESYNKREHTVFGLTSVNLIVSDCHAKLDVLNQKDGNLINSYEIGHRTKLEIHQGGLSEKPYVSKNGAPITYDLDLKEIKFEVSIDGVPTEVWFANSTQWSWSSTAFVSEEFKEAAAKPDMVRVADRAVVEAFRKQFVPLDFKDLKPCPHGKGPFGHPPFRPDEDRYPLECEECQAAMQGFIKKDADFYVSEQSNCSLM